MKADEAYHADLVRYYGGAFGCEGEVVAFNGKPRMRWVRTCRFLRFMPTNKMFIWVYATLGMSAVKGDDAVELFLMTRERSDSVVELLAAVVHYNQTGVALKMGDTVNFGRPWLDGSICTHGLISLPYTFGPALEKAVGARVLWLVPVTEGEVAYKKTFGLEALDARFEERAFDYLNAGRESVAP